MNIAFYRCPYCLYEFRKVFDHKAQRIVLCKKCGASVGWKTLFYDVKPVRKFASCQIDAMHADHPRYSDAMGINPDQEPEVRKRFPSLDLTFDPEGRLLVKNRKHKLELAKAFGMTEFDGLSWRKSEAQVKIRRSK